jgi:flagellar biosynthesis chaperone FliJ
MPRTHKADAGLMVALEQRQRTLDDAQGVLSQRTRALREQAQAVQQAEARVHMVLAQMDAAQRPAPGLALPVTTLGHLEILLDWCEVQVALAQQKLAAVQAEADEARANVATAHQGVRALELVLEARAAARAEAVRRDELRMADETAARVHARNSVGVRR